ncbi:Hypothetical protein, putative, partial [Bodo saltans]
MTTTGGMPSRMLAKSRLEHQQVHPLTSVITSPARPPPPAQAPHHLPFITSPLSPRHHQTNNTTTRRRGEQQQHQMTQPSAEETLAALQKRDNDLLSVFRVRRERYDEALARANKILDAFGDATELLPKEHRVQVKTMQRDGSPMEEPHPMYHLKPHGRDVRVFNDSSWVEDPFQLDDVDAEEQAELSEFVKRKEAKRNAQKAAEAKAAAAKAAAAAAAEKPKNAQQRRPPPAAVFEAGLHAMAA